MDRREFSEEALAHAGPLYNLARWLTPEPTEAEDLVQETFLKALRSWQQFQPGTNLKAWLFTILRNDFLNRRKRERLHPLAGEAEPEAEGGVPGNPAAPLPPALLRADLDAAMGKLPESLRTVVLLADVEEMKLEEVARVMGDPVGTVKSRLWRARRRLRDLLGDYRPGGRAAP